MSKCKYPNELCANMTMLNGTAYCDSVPCILKNEVPKKTNADKIRAMSDEELAEFLDDGVPSCTDYCPDFKAGCAFGCKYKQGKDFLVKWLQSEAK